MTKEQVIFEEKVDDQKSFKNKLKLTLSSISGAFMFPIATLAITAIFLSLGGFIESVSSNRGVQLIGTAIKSIAYPILQALPILFCVAFSISFCKNDITCVWAALIAYLVFISVQGAFIWPDKTLINNASSGGTSATGTYNIDNVRVPGYVVLFPGLGRSSTSMVNIVDRTLGITTLNTSIFGSFVIGGIMIPYIQRRWMNVQLPGATSFFSGKRLVPLIAAIAGAWTALAFLLFWPWIGSVFSYLGRALSSAATFGLDSFIFGFLEKSMIPFGLHHMFYAPLWYSSLGGDVIGSINETVTCGNQSSINLAEAVATTSSTTCSPSSGNAGVSSDAIKMLQPTTAAGALWDLFSGARAPHTMWQGDSFIGMSAISLPSNYVTFNNGNGTTSTLNVMDFLKQKLNVNVGRFTQGKYSIMQFGLPAAGLAMIYSAPIHKRKEAAGTIVPAILSSALMGITEPMEFTFLFIAPTLFYGFHAVMCGVSFGLMNIFGAHMPCILSGGLIEAIILGVIPVMKGTQFWWYIVIGIFMFPIYFMTFKLAIKGMNLQTPGREGLDGETTQPETQEVSTSKVPEATRKLALAFGGWDNLGNISNCASRLRYDIVDKSKVDEVALKKAGVIAIKWIGDNHVQAIVGPKAEAINNEMLKWRGEDLG